MRSVQFDGVVERSVSHSLTHTGWCSGCTIFAFRQPEHTRNCRKRFLISWLWGWSRLISRASSNVSISGFVQSRCCRFTGTGWMGATLNRGFQSSFHRTVSKYPSMICFRRESRYRPHTPELGIRMSWLKLSTTWNFRKPLSHARPDF